jgi:protein gp37
MADTAIEWATKVWNPVLGCEPVSEGCAHCYAKGFHARLRGQGHPNYQREFGDAYFAPESDWDAPGKWRKPQRIFVCSMGDPFYERQSPVVLQWVCDTAYELPCMNHKFLLLTKRAEQMARIATSWGHPEIRKNVWLGVTIENQWTAGVRLPLLAKCREAGWHTFISCEPLLEEVNICIRHGRDITDEAYSYAEVDWVIAGPETGPGKRSCDPEWLKDLHVQSFESGVPFFLKKQADGSPAPRELQQFPDELILPWERE